MAWNGINTSEVDAKSPIDENLMNNKIKNNDDDHEARILALEGGGPSGGGGDVDPKEYFADIIAGGGDDLGILWKRRFHPSQNTLTNGANQEGFDIEGKERNDRFIFPDFEDNYSFFNNPGVYLGSFLEISKSGKIQFKIKKGENFFSIGNLTNGVSSDNVEIYIDGVLASGFEDENGNPTTGTYSAISSPTFVSKTNFFYKLDGNEHLVTILNNDSASKTLTFEFIEVGFRSNNPTISHTMKQYAGRARVRGSEVAFNEGDFSFSEPGEGLAWGHEGMIKIDQTGTLTAVDGISPAMTQAKPETNIPFSGTVTNIKVKNHYPFPLQGGICLVSIPTGQHHLMSYSSKLEPDVANQSLDGIIWQSKPTEDFIPLDGFTGTTNEARGDVNINLFAKAPIQITASNNRVDFEIVKNGGATLTRSATLANGFYSADLVPLSKAFEKSMQAAEPINGDYFLKYNADAGRWTIGCNDPEVDSISFLFSSGANQANSIHPTLGFPSSDLSGSFSYIGTNEVRHLAQRVFIPNREFTSANSPKFKYSWGGNASEIVESDLVNRLGFSSYRSIRNTTGSLIQFYPDDNSCGCSFSLLAHSRSGNVAVQIDDGPDIYPAQFDNSRVVNDPPRAMIQSFFISWPRGSRKISIRCLDQQQWQRALDGSTGLTMIGAREFFIKPNFETLLNTERILKTIRVHAQSLYLTNYGNNGGSLYSPGNVNPSTDQINTITEVGSWGSTTGSAIFNGGGARFTNTLNDYVDINFTLKKDGGGIFLKNVYNVNQSVKIGMFISTGAINETTDRIQNIWNFYATTYYDQNSIGLTGLKSGTYTARFKNEAGARFQHHAIVVIDGEQAKENALVHAEIDNAGQGLSYPANVYRENIQLDSYLRTPQYLERSGYKDGRVSNINYFMNSPTPQIIDDSSSLFLLATSYFQSELNENVTNAGVEFKVFAKSIMEKQAYFSSYTGPVQPQIDGVNAANTYTSNDMVKGGTSPSSTRGASGIPFVKNFQLSCSYSGAGLTYNIADTRGLRDGGRYRLFDGTNYEDVIIENIVVSTSFDIKKAPSLVVPANVERIDFYGFHNIKMTKNTASNTDFEGFEYEPLPLTPSKFKNIITRKTFMETKVVVFRGISNGNDLYYPTHSDGISGNWSTSSIEIIGKNTSNAYSFPYDLKDVSVSSGTIDVKITSRRMIAEDIEEKF